GNPFPVADHVVVDARVAALSTSAAGPIVYRPGYAGARNRQLAWFDRSGNELGKVGDPDSFGWPDLSLSPDGRGRPSAWAVDARLKADLTGNRISSIKSEGRGLHLPAPQHAFADLNDSSVLRHPVILR